MAKYALNLFFTVYADHISNTPQFDSYIEKLKNLIEKCDLHQIKISLLLSGSFIEFLETSSNSVSHKTLLTNFLNNGHEIGTYAPNYKKNNSGNWTQLDCSPFDVVQEDLADIEDSWKDNYELVNALLVDLGFSTELNKTIFPECWIPEYDIKLNREHDFITMVGTRKNFSALYLGHLVYHPFHPSISNELGHELKENTCLPQIYLDHYDQIGLYEKKLIREGVGEYFIDTRPDIILYSLGRALMAKNKNLNDKIWSFGFSTFLSALTDDELYEELCNLLTNISQKYLGCSRPESSICSETIQGISAEFISWRTDHCEPSSFSFEYDFFLPKIPYLFPTKVEEVRIKNIDNSDLYAHIHWPIAPPDTICGTKVQDCFPGIVMLSGDGSLTSCFSPDFLASQGYVVIHYDEAGTGRSQGIRNYGGYKDQDDFKIVVNYLKSLQGVQDSNIGAISLSIRLSTAIGSIARYPELDMKYLMDWEGPADRFHVTINNTDPLYQDFHTSNDDFWAEREPVKFAPSIKCKYLRIQTEKDHRLDCDISHAIAMINSTTHLNYGGKGQSVFTQLNQNAPNQIYATKKTRSFQMPEYWLPGTSFPNIIENHAEILLDLFKKISDYTPLYITLVIQVEPSTSYTSDSEHFTNYRNTLKKLGVTFYNHQAKLTIHIAEEFADACLQYDDTIIQELLDLGHEIGTYVPRCCDDDFIAKVQNSYTAVSLLTGFIHNLSYSGNYKFENWNELSEIGFQITSVNDLSNDHSYIHPWTLVTENLGFSNWQRVWPIDDPQGFLNYFHGDNYRHEKIDEQEMIEITESFETYLRRSRPEKINVWYTTIPLSALIDVEFKILVDWLNINIDKYTINHQIEWRTLNEISTVFNHWKTICLSNQPDTPELLEVTFDDEVSANHLKWQIDLNVEQCKSVDKISSFTVYRSGPENTEKFVPIVKLPCTGPTCSSGCIVDNQNTSIITREWYDYKIISNSNYCYKIKAFSDNYGWTDFSNTICVLTESIATIQPPALNDINHLTSGNAIYITWDALSSARPVKSYNIYYKECESNTTECEIDDNYRLLQSVGGQQYDVIISDFCDLQKRGCDNRIKQRQEQTQNLFVVDNNDTTYALLRGSVVSDTLEVKYYEEIYTKGRDYDLVSAGNDNKNKKAQMVIYKRGRIEKNIALQISYQYGFDYLPVQTETLCGCYDFYITVTDFAGNESEPSECFRIEIQPAAQALSIPLWVGTGAGVARLSFTPDSDLDVISCSPDTANCTIHDIATLNPLADLETDSTVVIGVRNPANPIVFNSINNGHIPFDIDISTCCGVYKAEITYYSDTISDLNNCVLLSSGGSTYSTVINLNKHKGANTLYFDIKVTDCLFKEHIKSFEYILTDETPLLVEIISPTNNETINSDQELIVISVNDKIKLQTLSICIDNNPFTVACTEEGNICNYVWDVLSLTYRNENNIPLQAKTIDNENTEWTSDIINVSLVRDTKGPIINCIYPRNDYEVSDCILIKAELRDSSGVKSARIKIGNSAYIPVTLKNITIPGILEEDLLVDHCAKLLEYSWCTYDYANGDVAITIEATDSFDNINTCTIVVKNNNDICSHLTLKVKSLCEIITSGILMGIGLSCANLGVIRFVSRESNTVLGIFQNAFTEDAKLINCRPISSLEGLKIEFWWKMSQDVDGSATWGEDQDYWTDPATPCDHDPLALCDPHGGPGDCEEPIVFIAANPTSGDTSETYTFSISSISGDFTSYEWQIYDNSATPVLVATPDSGTTSSTPPNLTNFDFTDIVTEHGEGLYNVFLVLFGPCTDEDGVKGGTFVQVTAADETPSGPDCILDYSGRVSVGYYSAYTGLGEIFTCHAAGSECTEGTYILASSITGLPNPICNNDTFWDSPTGQSLLIDQIITKLDNEGTPLPTGAMSFSNLNTGSHSSSHSSSSSSSSSDCDSQKCPHDRIGCEICCASVTCKDLTDEPDVDSGQKGGKYGNIYGQIILVNTGSTFRRIFIPTIEHSPYNPLILYVANDGSTYYDPYFKQLARKATTDVQIESPPKIDSLPTYTVNNVVFLSWERNPGSPIAEIQKYELLRSTEDRLNIDSPLSEFEPVYLVDKSLTTEGWYSYTDRDVINGQVYFYILRAYDALGNYIESNTVFTVLDSSNSIGNADDVFIDYDTNGISIGQDVLLDPITGKRLSPGTYFTLDADTNSNLATPTSRDEFTINYSYQAGKDIILQFQPAINVDSVVGNVSGSLFEDEHFIFEKDTHFLAGSAEGSDKIIWKKLEKRISDEQVIRGNIPNTSDVLSNAALKDVVYVAQNIPIRAEKMSAQVGWRLSVLNPEISKYINDFRQEIIEISRVKNVTQGVNYSVTNISVDYTTTPVNIILDFIENSSFSSFPEKDDLLEVDYVWKKYYAPRTYEVDFSQGAINWRTPGVDEPDPGEIYLVTYNVNAPLPGEQLTITYSYNNLIRSLQYGDFNLGFPGLEDKRNTGADVLAKEATQVEIDLTLLLTLKENANETLVVNEVSSRINNVITSKLMGKNLKMSEIVREVITFDETVESVEMNPIDRMARRDLPRILRAEAEDIANFKVDPQQLEGEVTFYVTLRPLEDIIIPQGTIITDTVDFDNINALNAVSVTNDVIFKASEASLYFNSKKARYEIIVPVKTLGRGVNAISANTLRHIIGELTYYFKVINAKAIDGIVITETINGSDSFVLYPSKENILELFSVNSWNQESTEPILANINIIQLQNTNISNSEGTDLGYYEPIDILGFSRGSSLVFEDTRTFQTEVNTEPSNVGEYFVDYERGLITVFGVTPAASNVTYKYKHSYNIDFATISDDQTSVTLDTSANSNKPVPTSNDILNITYKWNGQALPLKYTIEFVSLENGVYDFGELDKFNRIIYLNSKDRPVLPVEDHPSLPFYSYNESKRTISLFGLSILEGDSFIFKYETFWGDVWVNYTVTDLKQIGNAIEFTYNFDPFKLRIPEMRYQQIDAMSVEDSPGLIINGGSETVNINTVIVHLQAPGATEVLLSNYSDFREVTDSNFQELKRGIVWELLDGEGTRNVYAIFKYNTLILRDQVVSDTVEVDYEFDKGDFKKVPTLDFVYTVREGTFLNVVESFDSRDIIVNSKEHVEPGKINIQVKPERAPRD